MLHKKKNTKKMKYGATRSMTFRINNSLQILRKTFWNKTVSLCRHRILFRFHILFWYTFIFFQSITSPLPGDEKIHTEWILS